MIPVDQTALTQQQQTVRPPSPDELQGVSYQITNNPFPYEGVNLEQAKQQVEQVLNNQLMMQHYFPGMHANQSSLPSVQELFKTADHDHPPMMVPTLLAKLDNPGEQEEKALLHNLTSRFMHFPAEQQKKKEPEVKPAEESRDSPPPQRHTI